MKPIGDYMTDKSWELLTKLIDACGYDITEIEDEFDFDELCNDIKNKLAHKMQEYEKLKSQVDEDYNYYTTELKTLRDIISNKEKRNAALFLTSGRYRKALEEIEKVCLEDTYTFADGTEVRYDSLDDILDIISKAKGGK